jgi:hypothetical protein
MDPPSAVLGGMGVGIFFQVWRRCVMTRHDLAEQLCDAELFDGRVIGVPDSILDEQRAEWYGDEWQTIASYIMCEMCAEDVMDKAELKACVRDVKNMSEFMCRIKEAHERHALTCARDCVPDDDEFPCGPLP